MERRHFLLGCAAAAAGCSSVVRPAARARTRVAITMDDPNTEPTPYYSWGQRSDALIAQLGARDVQVMLFVCGKRVDSADGAALLRRFDGAGHLLANHSYAHHNYHDSALTSAQFAADIARC
ncbi:MAG TPA: polysaccharide deacetylase family protein, partial [Polyangiales bacterium]